MTRRRPRPASLDVGRMRTLKLTVAYDGTAYAGWQIQRGGIEQSSAEHPTIQGTLERALRQIVQEPARVIGSGRTDAGVHALAQVAHVRTRSTLPLERLQRSLNGLLPIDIAVTAIAEAPPAFHARFLAARKRYRYRVFLGPVVPPFIRRYVHHVRDPLNVALMRREARGLQAKRDFRAFAVSSGRGRNTVRVITEMLVIRRGKELHIEVEGTGFLHRMVRSIAGTLLDVGRGRRPEGTIRRMLRTGARRLAGTTAPARGLTLVSVTYGRGKSQGEE